MDQDQLRLLSIFHYVVGGLIGLCASVPLIHLAIGIAWVTGNLPQNSNQGEMDVFFGWLFIVVGAMAISLGWTLALLVLIAGRQLAARRRYTYCLVVAGLECLFMPFGTVLGVFTILVLARPSVKALFGEPVDPLA